MGKMMNANDKMNKQLGKTDKFQWLVIKITSRWEKTDENEWYNEDFGEED